ncbi:MAG: hypothetical protein PHO47_07410 [Firmicutes bacterium]|nr:hypothetical protein [Bacillota bacterium]
MIRDFIWKAFEKTGDTRYYLEYKKWQDAYYKQQKSARNERMDKTG